MKNFYAIIEAVNTIIDKLILSLEVDVIIADVFMRPWNYSKISVLI